MSGQDQVRSAPVWRCEGDDVAAAGERSALCCCLEDDVTVQSFVDETDIHSLLSRFGVVGSVPTVRVAPSFGDFSNVGDLQDAYLAMREVGEVFDHLDPAIKLEFGNSPGAFLRFVGDPQNRQEWARIGLEAIPTPSPIPNPAPEGDKAV